MKVKLVGKIKGVPEKDIVSPNWKLVYKNHYSVPSPGEGYECRIKVYRVSDDVLVVCFKERFAGGGANHELYFVRVDPKFPYKWKLHTDWGWTGLRFSEGKEVWETNRSGTLPPVVWAVIHAMENANNG